MHRMTAATSKFTASFPNGVVASRRSAAAYTHASMRSGSRTVRFHTSAAAARRAAGVGGSVVAVVASGVRSAAPVSTGCRFVVGANGSGRCGAPVVAAHGTYRASCSAHAAHV